MALSVRDMAAALGVSKSQIARDKLDGMPMDDIAAARAWREAHRDLSRSVEGRIDRPTAAPATVQVLPPGPDEPSDPPEDDDTARYKAARAEREEIARDRQRLELDQLRGRLIDVDEAGRMAFTNFRGLRDAVLQVPTRVAPQAAAETDPLRVEQLFEAELVAAFARFDEGRLLADLDDEEEGDEAG